MNLVGENVERVNDFTYLRSNAVLSGDLDIYNIILLKSVFYMKGKYVDKLTIHDATEHIICIHASGVEDHGIMLRFAEQR